MIFLIVTGVLLLLVAASFFAFPKLSPIPYFPSNKKDLPHIMRTLGLKSNQVIVDLGAGDGTVIFAAARKTYERNLNTQYVAVEINPILIGLLYLKRFFHKNNKNISIVFGDMFTMNHRAILPTYKSEVVYYLYISPWLLEKVVQTIKEHVEKFYVVSYMYALPQRKHVKKIIGKHAIFRYRF